MLLWHRVAQVLPLLLLQLLLDLTELPSAAAWLKFNSYTALSKKRTDLRKKCPNVRAIRNFDLELMMGNWHVVQYYASTEELPEYACMRSNFAFSSEDQHITMNFSYIYAEDPLREKLQGNITWLIPDFGTPGHWMHTEDIYEGIYNTYVLDTDYKNWGLIMHCAEKKKHPRYLSALLLSRQPTLGDNVITFLREKLPRYDIDLSFMFAINQTSCEHLMESSKDDPLAYIVNGQQSVANNIKLINKP
ncbi:PREDICTED: insecticyanin-A [Drosophila arizonae]|uniref:Insecticyanin-A n=1 Tax=Drosophila arizonae TaxID=7263 RepID=A0ABM1PR20_DROAR|nr:PREDICTED: insecticyanin-A [Drosophila arizonae]